MGKETNMMGRFFNKGGELLVRQKVVDKGKVKCKGVYKTDKRSAIINRKPLGKEHGNASLYVASCYVQNGAVRRFYVAVFLSPTEKLIYSDE